MSVALFILMLTIFVIDCWDVEHAEQSHLHVLKLAINHLKSQNKSISPGEMWGRRIFTTVDKGAKGSGQMLKITD